jgi:Legionella pneumophila major outer membrane protein precursor
MGLYQGGLEFATKINQNVKNKSKIEYNPGFKIKAYYIKRWKISAEWNYITIDQTDIASPDAQELEGMYYPPQTGSLTGANAALKGSFNVWDLKLSKPYQVSKKYISVPSIGIQGALLDEDYHLRYFVLNQKYNLFLKNDFWALGWKGGYESIFYLGKNFSFYGLANFGILYSRFTVFQMVDNFSIYNYKLSNKNFSTLLPNVQIALGFSYAKMFFQNNLQATIKLGYEMQNWWGVNQFEKPMATNPVGFKPASRKSMTFNGLILSLLLDL